MVGGLDLSAAGDASVYLVDGPGRAVLIDAGTGQGEAEVARNIEAAGVPAAKISHLVLTHCHIDHSGGIPGLKQRFGLKVIAHQRGAEILAAGDDPRTAASWYGMKLPPMIVDAPFDADEFRLPLGDTDLVLIPIPGHSPDSIAAYLDRDGQRVLFGQDVHGPIHPALASDPRLYRQSLNRLLALHADILCEGHFGIYQPAEEVAEYIKSFLE
jgi:glyoxylase-like metal-dependent hydrolase (beta-lactamase superfamily II)